MTQARKFTQVIAEFWFKDYTAKLMFKDNTENILIP